MKVTAPPAGNSSTFQPSGRGGVSSSQGGRGRGRGRGAGARGRGAGSQRGRATGRGDSSNPDGFHGNGFHGGGGGGFGPSRNQFHGGSDHDDGSGMNPGGGGGASFHGNQFRNSMSNIGRGQFTNQSEYYYLSISNLTSLLSNQQLGVVLPGPPLVVFPGDLWTRERKTIPSPAPVGKWRFC